MTGGGELEGRGPEGSAAGLSSTDARLRRSFILLHVVGPLFGLVIPALLAGADSTPDGVVAVLTAGICAFWLLPLLVMRSRSLDWPAFASVQLLVSLSLYGCYHYGGLASPFAVWLIVAVLLSFLYAPRRLLWCLGAGALQVVSYLALREVAGATAARVSAGSLGLVTAASVMAATLYISLIAAFYARLKIEGSALAEMARDRQDAVLRLRAAVRQAETASDAVSGFIASMNHELRTSLNVVIGYSEMLAEDASDREAAEAEGTLRTVTGSSRALLAMVEEAAVIAEKRHASAPAEPVPIKISQGSRTAPLAQLPSKANRFKALITGGRTGAHQTWRDELTGMANRAAFMAGLDRGLAEHSGKPVALLTADLNGFKEVNDSLGHDVGDQLLRVVADRFVAATPSRILLARLGGDEFGAAAFGEDAQATILGLAETMVEALATPIPHDEDYLTVGISIGVARGAAGSVTGKELLRRADVAMYCAKGRTPDPIQEFDPSMDEALRFKRTVRQDLAAAIANDEFELVLQPVVEARSGAMASAEALLRWRHAVLGYVSPAKLIAMAEESGQITAIDDWVLERTLTYAARLRTLPIAINVSPTQFRHSGFAQKIVDRLAAHGIEPGLLRLEITEGVLVTHTTAAARTISELREAGIKIALDDFGTGFSSLSYLKDLPFDLLKIDRTFVSELDRGHKAAELLRAIIHLGHSLGMGVIAEGVETAAQASVVQLFGGDFIQGYFTGRPAAIEAIEARLRGGSTAPIRQAAVGG